jgi:hypothetical protein
MKSFALMAAAAAMSLAGAGAGHAVLTSTVSGGGIGTGCNTSSTSGALAASCSGGSFSEVALTASGPPLVSAPDLTTTELTVTSGPSLAFPVTLDAIIRSSGFTFGGGPVEALFTVNNLIGTPPGPFVLTASAPVGTLSHTFHGAGSETDGPTVLAGFTNDSTEALLTFTGPNQSVDATIEIVGTPVAEPAGIAILGVGLLGLAVVRRRRYLP